MGRLLHVAPRRLCKDQGKVRAALRLVLFDDPAIVSPLVHNRLCPLALGQKRIHRDHAAFQNQLVQESLYGGDLIGFVIHGVWSQRHAHVVRQRR
jgi:hypothetical protein